MLQARGCPPPVCSALPLWPLAAPFPGSASSTLPRSLARLVMHKLGPAYLTVNMGEPLERSSDVPAQLCQLLKPGDRQQQTLAQPPPVVQSDDSIRCYVASNHLGVCVSVSSEGGHWCHSPAFVTALKWFSTYYVRHLQQPPREVSRKCMFLFLTNGNSDPRKG